MKSDKAKFKIKDEQIERLEARNKFLEAEIIKVRRQLKKANIIEKEPYRQGMLDTSNDHKVNK